MTHARLTLALVAALLAAALAGVADAKEIFYEPFSYAPGTSLAEKGRRAPDFDAKVYEKNDKGPNRQVFALVTPKGLSVQGQRDQGNAAYIGTEAPGKAEEGHLRLAKAVQHDVKKNEMLYMSVLMNIPQERDLPYESMYVGVRLRFTQVQQRGKSDKSAELGCYNSKNEANYYVSKGWPPKTLTKAVAGQTVQLVMRLVRAEKGDWELEGIANPGLDEPKEGWQKEDFADAGLLRLEGIELFAARKKKHDKLNRAAGILDEIRIGTTWDDVVPNPRQRRAAATGGDADPKAQD